VQLVGLACVAVVRDALRVVTKATDEDLALTLATPPLPVDLVVRVEWLAISTTLPANVSITEMANNRD